MHTRCPACDALYELSPEELAEAAGVVRCSNCGKTFNSLAQLFTDRPEAGEAPLRGKGMPPLLAHRVLLQPELPGVEVNDLTPETMAQAAVEEHPQPSERASARGLMWQGLAGALGLLAVAQSLWLVELPQRWLAFDSHATASAAPAEAIALIGRDLHAHPSREGAVVVSALLRNTSAQLIDFPLIELRLFDRSNQLLGVRRLQPEDYLPDPARAPSGFAPGASLPVIVELALIGSDPAGFELRFF